MPARCRGRLGTRAPRLGSALVGGGGHQTGALAAQHNRWKRQHSLSSGSFYLLGLSRPSIRTHSRLGTVRPPPPTSPRPPRPGLLHTPPDGTHGLQGRVGTRRAWDGPALLPPRQAGSPGGAQEHRAVPHPPQPGRPPSWGAPPPPGARSLSRGAPTPGAHGSQAPGRQLPTPPLSP